MKVECYGCGGDCSQAYGTYQGDPYHFGCIPVKRTANKPPLDTLLSETDIAALCGGKKAIARARQT